MSSKVGSYKGHPTISLGEGEYPFTFGLSKARLVLEHLDEIRAFVDGASGKASEVIEIRLSSGAVVTQNRRGRCEDAPCCGCCS